MLQYLNYGQYSGLGVLRVSTKLILSAQGERLCNTAKREREYKREYTREHEGGHRLEQEREQEHEHRLENEKHRPCDFSIQNAGGSGQIESLNRCTLCYAIRPMPKMLSHR